MFLGFEERILKRETESKSGIDDAAVDLDSLRIKATGRLGSLAYVLMGFLFVYTIVRGVTGALAKPFWFDELLTLAIVSQPNLHDLWAAVSRGFDAQPPLFYLVEAAALKIPGDKQVLLRLPSIVAFACTLICVFVYAKKRSGELIACLCALLLLSSSLYHVYSMEARPYSLTIACLAFALVCYQRLPSIRWTVLLGFSLLLAGSFHYYAIFAMMPFALAESVFSLRTRRLRWPVWIALASGTLPLAVSWPLLSKIKNYIGPHFRARPDLTAVRGYYGQFFSSSDGAFGMALAAVAVASVAWCHFWPRAGVRMQTVSNESDVPEGSLLLGWIALPFIAFAAAQLMHGMLLSRYVLSTTIALVLGVACALSIAGRKAAALFMIFIFCLVGISESTFWRHPEFHPFVADFSAGSMKEFSEIENFVQKAGHSDLPIVFAQGMLYSQVVFYSSGSWTKRLVYLTDETSELTYHKADNFGKTINGLSEFFPLQIADYSTFTTTHPVFLLYSDHTEWTIDSVFRQADLVQLLQVDGPRRIYLVKMKDNNGAGDSAVSAAPGGQDLTVP